MASQQQGVDSQHTFWLHGAWAPSGPLRKAPTPAAAMGTKGAPCHTGIPRTPFILFEPKSEVHPRCIGDEVLDPQNILIMGRWRQFSV